MSPLHEIGARRPVAGPAGHEISARISAGTRRVNRSVMMPAGWLKPAAGAVVVAALAGAYYWLEYRPRPQPTVMPAKALVTVARSVNACFSDLVRVTGFVVPRREAVAGVEHEGSKVTELLVREGDMVSQNQELARLTAPLNPANPATRPGPLSLRAPAAGLVTQVNTIAGAPASPQAGPMFRIAINNEIELDAEVPGIHVLKLNPGATTRISRDGAPDLAGRVRLVSPEINRGTQLGHVRITLASDPSLKIGMFARASIDARRSCGIAVPRAALDHLTVQVVKDSMVETRRVKVGLVSDTSTEILEGLEVGEIVVADAGTSLHDGDRIHTVFADELDGTRVR
jgi:multidrug efflux pump subunit AcrA (membrane-fusion protein)